MKLSSIQRNILINRLIDTLGIAGIDGYREYADNVIADVNSYESISDMINSLILNYGILIIG